MRLLKNTNSVPESVQLTFIRIADIDALLRTPVISLSGAGRTKK